MRDLKRYLAVVIAIAMMFTLMAPAFAASTATDYKKVAEKLNTLGLYKGIDQNVFNPDLNSTLDRQTGATMLLRMFGQEEEALQMEDKVAMDTLKQKFPNDYASIAPWAAKQVAFAVEAGVINGVGNGKFEPKGLLQGLQYCTLVLRQLGYDEKDFTYEEAGKKFAEIANLDATTAAAFGVKGAIKKEILIGISDKALDLTAKDATTTLIQELVKNGTVTEAAAIAAGYTIPKTPTKPVASVTPAVYGTPTPGGVAPAVYGKVNVTWEAIASKSVAQNQALVTIGKLTLKTAEGGQITGLKVLRSGLSKDTDVTSLTIWDGSKRLNVPTLFSNSIANITFTSIVNVVANEDKVLSVKMNVADDATIASQIIPSVTEIKTATTTSLNAPLLPFAAGTYTVANVNLGVLKVKMSADRPTANLDAGTSDVRLAKYDLAASEEAQVVKQITFTQNGSAGDGDIKNVKLFDGTTQLGATAQIADRKVTYTFEREVASGETLRLTLKGDVVGGAGRNSRLGIADETDVQAVGKTYGTDLVGNLRDVTDTNDISYEDGQLLNINQGSFLVSRDSSTIAAATISNVVDDQDFLTMRVEAVGEPIQLRKINVGATTSTQNKNLTGLKIKMGTTTVADIERPFENSSGASILTNTIPLSTPVIVNPGQPVIFVFSADIKSTVAALNGDTYLMSLPLSSTALEGVGQVSGRTINYNATAGVTGNTMTVGDLKLKVERVPASNENVFVSETAKKLVEFNLNHNLAEKVSVSQLNVTLNKTGSGSVLTDFSNVKLVDDTGAVVSEVISKMSTEAGAPTPQINLVLKNAIEISPAQTVKLGLVADVLSSAEAGSYQFNISSVTSETVARTTKSGTSIQIAAPTNNQGKTVSVSTGGASIIAVRSTGVNLDNKNVYAGDTNVQIGAYSFYSASNGYENATITKMKFTKELSVATAAAATSYTLTCTKDDANNDTVVIRLRDINDVAVDITTTTDATDVTSIAGSIKTAIEASSVASLYTVGQAVGVLTITRNFTGVSTAPSLVSALDTNSADLSLNYVFALVTAGSVTTAVPMTDELSSQYFTNVRVVKVSDNTVLGTIGSLDTTATDVSLTVPVTVPKYSSTISIPDRTATVVVLADILPTAPYGKRLAIRLGDGDNATKDVEYQAAQTGVSASLKTVDLASNSAGKDAIYTTGAAKLTVTAKTAVGTQVIHSSTSAEVARFTIKNNSSRSVQLKYLSLSDVKSALAGKFDQVILYKASSGAPLATGAAGGLFTLGANYVQFNPQEEIEFTLEADLSAGTGASLTAAGIGTQIKIEQGTTPATGTIYTVTGDVAPMTIDDSYALPTVTTKNP